jgi:hypothetical protein
MAGVVDHIGYTPQLMVPYGVNVAIHAKSGPERRLGPGSSKIHQCQDNTYLSVLLLSFVAILHE